MNPPGCTQLIHRVLAQRHYVDFCESRNLQQLIDFSTHRNAVLDLLLSQHPDSVGQLPNLNTSDDVTVLLILHDFSIPTSTLPDR